MFHIEPIVKDYSCILESSLVYNNLHVILLSAYVTQGAPTTIKCHLANSSVGYELTKITEERILENRNVSRVLVGYLIPFSMTPNEVKCTIANGDGSDSFKCSIQGSPFCSVNLIWHFRVWFEATSSKECY